MNNCLTYVLGKIRAERKAGRRGGYILIRRSYLARDFGITSRWHPASWVPHFLHRDQDGVITQYQPSVHYLERERELGLFGAWLHLWHFDGQVVGDDYPGHYREGLHLGPVVVERSEL